MDRLDIEKLIAMLGPTADEGTVAFVINQIMQKHSGDSQNPAQKRTLQQNVNPYDGVIANDPRFW